MDYFQELEKTLKRIPLNKVDQLYGLLANHTGQVFVCGNGGSAATASHFATDLGKNSDLKVMSFDSIPALTMYANDYSYIDVFRKQLWKHSEMGDIVILITTSGTSRNILSVVIRGDGLSLVLLTGPTGIGVKDTHNISLHINVPSTTIEIVEDCHIAILHSVVRRFKDNE